MLIRHSSPIAHTAEAALVFAIVGMVLGTASANPPATRTVATTSIPNARTESPAQESASTTVTSNVADQQSSAGQQSRQPAGSCRVIDRPKHKVVQCECSSDPLSSVASVDAVAILRLLLGNRTCRAPSLARK